MNNANRWIAMALALVGVGVCLAAVAGFFATVSGNGLPWKGGETVRDYYLTVGHFYGEGFVVGFFLCFFLMLAAVILGTWFQQRREQAAISSIEPRRDAPAGGLLGKDPSAS